MARNPGVRTILLTPRRTSGSQTFAGVITQSRKKTRNPQNVHVAAPTSAARSEQAISLRKRNMSNAPRKNVIAARKVRLTGIGSRRLIRKSGS